MINMQIFPKTKGFCNIRGRFRKKLTLLNKNYICILRKNSNPEYRVLEKIRFLEKIETPELLIIQPPPALKYTFSLISNAHDLYVCLVITCQRKGGVCKFIAQPLLVIIRTIRFLSTIDPVVLTNTEVNPETILHFFFKNVQV